jgi:hypothetical protein
VQGLAGFCGGGGEGARFPWVMFRRLVVLHYHFRPGGVRSVISCGLAAAAERLGVREVVMLSGESAASAWQEDIGRRLAPLRVSWVVDGALGYWSELSPEERAADPAEVLRGMVTADTALWVHNLSVGRQLRLAAAVGKVVEETGAEAWLQQHDWWWDGRWERWPEFAEQGIGSLRAALAATLIRHPKVHHVCINPDDAEFVGRLGGVACWSAGNPVLPPVVAAEELSEAGDWLRAASGGRRTWLYPARALRRKNPAEALLVMNLVDPGSVLATTGGPSSAAERPWWDGLAGAAAEQGWPLLPAVCGVPGSPAVPALMAAAARIVCTSLREGFGLPCWEAAVLSRPLVVRRLAQTRRTLAEAGVDLSGGYDALFVPVDSFDAGAEQERTAEGRGQLVRLLPAGFRDLLERSGKAVPVACDFGSLSAMAQQEVLAGPLEPVRQCNRWLAALSGIRTGPVPDVALAAPRRWAGRFFARPVRFPAGGPGEMSPLEAGIRQKVQAWLSQPLLWP